MPLAADYPFLNILWTMIIFFAWVVWIWIMVVILTDVFRRRDIGGWGKAAWTVFLLVIPFLGALTYLIFEHDGMAERREKEVRAEQTAIDQHIRAVAGGDGGGATGPAGEIAHAKRLLDEGAITQEEYERLKQAALSGAPGAPV